MKQSLQLRLGQHLTMTPQLQQAIRLLQLSTLELQTEVQQALESNMMLETAEDNHEGASVAAEAESMGVEPDILPKDIPQDLPVDSAWEDIYDVPTAGAPLGDGSALDNRALLLRIQHQRIQA